MPNKYTKLLAIDRRKGIETAISRLVDTRIRVTPAEYSHLIRAFRSSSPAAAAAIGRRIGSLEELYWVAPAASLTIEKELSWSVCWLKTISGRLSEHASRVHSAQRAFAQADYLRLLSIADESIAADGWSFWALELKIGALAATREFSAVKSEFADLQRKAAGRNSGLLLQMLLDRSDPTLSSGSYRSKCKAFFSKIDTQSRAGLIRMRSTRDIGSVEQLSWLMAWNLPSSYVDYYEDLIKAVDHMRLSSVLSVPRSELRDAFAGLNQLGVSDYRIVKLQRLLQDVPILHEEVSTGDAHLSELVDRCHQIQGFSSPFFTQDPAELNDALRACEEEGALASRAAERLIKFGSSFSCLPIAEAIEGRGYQRYFEMIDGVLLPGGGELASETLSVFQVATLSDDQISAFVSSSEHAIARTVRRTLSGESVAAFPGAPTVFDAWLALKLVELARFDEADLILRHLEGFGSAWKRAADKIRVKLEKSRRGLSAAIDLLVNWIVIAEEYELEFPVGAALAGVRWADVADVVPWKVGLVAHAANSLHRTSEARYLSRKACLKFHEIVSLTSLDDLITAAAPGEQAAIFEFLRRVWVEHNLTLVSDLASPEEVRESRLQVLQTLVSRDCGREEEYRREIQEITLDETLWKGLRELDINRVFVNEAAITRWAEKEFGEGYERFRSLQSESEIGAILQDPDVRNYLIEGDLHSLLTVQGKHDSAGLALVPIFVGLFHRFMNDPTDGLNAYLSLRVRHGTMRGTLLRAAEEERILVVGRESEEEFINRFGAGLPSEHTLDILALVRRFAAGLVSDTDTLVNEIVQIRSEAKPEGAFSVALDERTLSSVLTFADPSWSFQFFASQCYAVFWGYLEPSRAALSEYILEHYKKSCEDRYANIIGSLGTLHGSHEIEPLLLALQSSLTRTLTAIDAVSEWFVSDEASEERGYSLQVALDIAEKAVRNVFPEFDIERHDDFGDCSGVVLSAMGLTIVYDSLFVVLGNIWERSGLKGARPEVKVTVRWHEPESVLDFRIVNSLHPDMRAELESGRIERLRNKYLNACVSDLFAVEGGSGFAKLSRISRRRGREASTLDFNVENGRFWVSYQIQLHRRGDYFDAYL